MILYDIGLSLAEFFKMMSDFLLVHRRLIKNSHQRYAKLVVFYST